MTSIVLRWVGAEAPDGLELKPPDGLELKPLDGLGLAVGRETECVFHISAVADSDTHHSAYLHSTSDHPSTTHRPPINHPEMLGLHNAQRPGDVIAEVWGKRVVAHH